MKFTDKLDLLMEAKGINRRFLSKDANIPYTTISNWYQRGNGSMTMSTFKTLCDILM